LNFLRYVKGKNDSSLCWNFLPHHQYTPLGKKTMTLEKSDDVSAGGPAKFQARS
jgi:hypothetical protein